MHLTRRHPKALPGLAGDPGKQRRRVMGIQPVQRPSQTVVVQQLRRDPWPQQVLHGLGGKELRDQIQPAIAEAEPVEDHRHRRRAHAHLLLARSGHAHPDTPPARSPGTPRRRSPNDPAVRSVSPALPHEALLTLWRLHPSKTHKTGSRALRNVGRNIGPHHTKMFQEGPGII